MASLEIVIGGALAAILLGERLTTTQLAGAVVMLAGITVAQVGLASGSRVRLPEDRDLTPSSA